MIRGVHHISIHTKNLERILDFYQEAFGFMPVTEQIHWHENSFFDNVIGLSGTAGRLIMLKSHNLYLEVWEYTAPLGLQNEPLRPNDWGYTHFCVDTDNIEEDYSRLLRAGMKFNRPLPTETDGIRAIYGKDPDGNLIELQQVRMEHDFAFERLEYLALRADNE
ncbi:catechol 2,3-dioxygenase-like lactoylglutathione lyase family enzyme [Advenella incenata]|uniref:Catechol 2,3-dioxygenase-like lactoylglutathione lyase family enzyme n=1 Tax=Advenella incenata TaxID=267800 RepID=A0A4Q7VFT5_9BURK|nr:VOC family protein [Advenella incenata]RZT94850.1 catechol 2,3-dioxygenase-like lactoylglutathione lyase family enzyme [Advenella incenata]